MFSIYLEHIVYWIHCHHCSNNTCDIDDRNPFCHPLKCDLLFLHDGYDKNDETDVLSQLWILLQSCAYYCHGRVSVLFLSFFVLHVGKIKSNSRLMPLPWSSTHFGWIYTNNHHHRLVCQRKTNVMTFVEGEWLILQGQCGVKRQIQLCSHVWWWRIRFHTHTRAKLYNNDNICGNNAKHLQQRILAHEKRCKPLRHKYERYCT